MATKSSTLPRGNAPRVVTPGFDPGTRLPAHTSTAGRVLLAAQSDEDLHAYLERVTLIAYTHQTVADKEQLLRELLQIREQGFVVTDGQSKPVCASFRCRSKRATASWLAPRRCQCRSPRAQRPKPARNACRPCRRRPIR